jgi:hypothetical protein
MALLTPVVMNRPAIAATKQIVDTALTPLFPPSARKTPRGLLKFAPAIRVQCRRIRWIIFKSCPELYMRSISVPVSLGIVELPKDANMKSVTVLALLILIGTNSVTWCGQSGIIHPPLNSRFPGSRTTWQGEIWLGWLAPIQHWFVESAIAGYERGYDEGCADARAAVKRSQTRGQQNPELDCPHSERFRNKAPYYSTQMTDFCTRYPEDRDLPLAFLIKMLMGPKPKTLEEIHQSLRPRE